ncbi:MarR family transcriptional regulator [Embleya sp. NPDC005575]|uniref:MarR family winged helix-turn-helix transcriptional regulator n=1 Tax=Embleya sp. NPDC005575 TaxID=3156892 RepID=UPI0033B0793E
MSVARGEGDLPAELLDRVDALCEWMAAVHTHAHGDLGGRVSPSQLRALLVVADHDGINLNMLAARLRAMPSSASRLCDRLEGAGLLARELSATDRREVVLRLAPDGVGFVEELRSARRQALAKVLIHLEADDLDSLVRSLAVLRDAAHRAGGRD